MGSSPSTQEINVRTVTFQAVLFSLLSTTLAQCITSWSQQNAAFRVFPYFSFAVIAIITAPPNFIYQAWLEKTFPTLVSNKKQQRNENGEMREGELFSKTNAAKKFVLDQTIGAGANTVAFIVLNKLAQGYGLANITNSIVDEFCSMLVAGWRVWPFVTVTNLCFVPWDWRPVIGNTAGLCWGVYITIINLES